MLRYEVRRMKVRMKVIVVLAAVFFVNSNLADATTINHVSANINLTAQSANFEIVYNGVPDFLTVDSAGRPQDQFRVYIASPSASLPGNTWEGKFQNGDPWLTESLGTINVTHGLNPPFATLSFSQNSNIVDFSVPLSLLNLPSPNLLYLLVSYFFGAESTVAFLGASNGNLAQPVNPFSVIPLPATLPLFATGLAGLGLLGWRRKKKAIAA
jgi:hypothetical protein